MIYSKMHFKKHFKSRCDLAYLCAQQAKQTSLHSKQGDQPRDQAEHAHPGFPQAPGEGPLATTLGPGTPSKGPLARVP